MIDKNEIVRLAEEKLASSTIFLVDVQIKPGNMIVVEIDSDDAIGIDDCAELSRYIENALDREKEDFELEVGSAGITSPLKVFRQYKKYIGKEVELLLVKGIKVTGILKFADENGLVVVVEKRIKPEGAKRKVLVEEEQAYAFDEIKHTKYLLRFK
ncbi:ribosome assembly cofactor RimP [Massilibacteroides sp.]|uniref:ribosome assembly cofactor RimP n=1 Tax=Massilibacteroides sp. TaxID=2034766 RepID=UPI0026185975|nr:ribosome assembly cofactor RimP [Massilibacteroides sp.]MDD4514793.1 ribosome assembly cofactor RimP [Massilibacteroides sp.]